MILCNPKNKQVQSLWIVAEHSIAWCGTVEGRSIEFGLLYARKGKYMVLFILLSSSYRVHKSLWGNMNIALLGV